MSRVVALAIESIASGGDGVGRTDGLVVFVPRTAPGDVARVRIDGGRRFARGKLESIEKPGPSRIDPPCYHYVADRCGGCQVQHLTYEAQLESKSDIIRDAIQRIGKRPVDRPVVRPSPLQWRYRRKLTLALRRRDGDGGWIAGLHPYDAPGRIFDLHDCPITDARVLTVWKEIRAAAEWLPDVAELRGAVRVSASGDPAGASILLEGGTRWSTHEPFFERVTSIDALWWQPVGQSRRRLHARDRAVQDEGDDGGVGSQDPTGESSSGTDSADTSFVQVNVGVTAQLHAHVMARVLSYQPRTVIDAYAGSGDTAVPLAAAGAQVTAIEVDRDGAARGARRLPPPSRMIRGRVEDVLPSLLPADVIVLNPPRAGVDERVTTALTTVSAAPRGIVYVSCDPATLARDIARLPGYRVASLLGFDMFPQTAHVETVCELVPESQ